MQHFASWKNSCLHGSWRALIGLRVLRNINYLLCYYYDKLEQIGFPRVFPGAQSLLVFCRFVPS